MLMACEEQLSCSGAPAVYRCNKCETVQCADCSEQLHNLASMYYKTHVLKPLLPPCKGPCNPKRLASMLCEDCGAKLCESCDQMIHSTSGRRGGHKRSVMTGDVIPVSIALSAQQAEDRKQSEVEVKRPVAEVPLSSKGGATQKQERRQLEGRERSSSAHRQAGTSPDKNEVPVADLLGFESLNVTTLGTVTDPQQSTNVDLLSSNNSEDQPLTARLSETVPLRSVRRPQEVELQSREGESMLLVNTEEQLMVSSADELVKRLGIDQEDCVKVVSIFGNTGDGKSHTLNHAFFNGRRVFSTSPCQSSCTIGVWCAYNPAHHTLFLDTEGMLGATSRQKERTRLLLKVLAISDIVIYRTRAERLHNDMYTFLNDASEVYEKYFTAELQAIGEKLKLDKPHLGPVVIIFHETQHTDLLGEEVPKSTKGKSSHNSNANKLLQQRFAELKLSPNSFSGFHYIGTRTPQPPTEFSRLVKAVKTLVKDNSVRSPRPIEVVYKSLEVLNSKFSHGLQDETPFSFADEYFTCREKCLACSVRCMETMNHEKNDKPHKPKEGKDCILKHEFENKIYLCQTCSNRGKRSIVIPKAVSSKDSGWVGLVKYAWSGFILECSECGVIYKSRQSWYGNQGPVEAKAARVEIQHVWPGSTGFGQGADNAARRLLEGVAAAATSVGRFTAPAANVVSEWVNDKVAPSYWVPNCQIKACEKCKEAFKSDASKHHCRACGKGFCDGCSSKRLPVPWRGWGDTPVRVCDTCSENMQQEVLPADSDGNEAIPEGTAARRVTEAVCSAVGIVATAVGYSKELIKDSARPEYWVPDAAITECAVCKTEFGQNLTKHHCRACGQGVCNGCSLHRKPVPSHGWDNNVRVCDNCEGRKDSL